mgnify:CR=1 FL=1
MEIMIPLVSTESELRIMRSLVNRVAHQIEIKNKAKVKVAKKEILEKINNIGEINFFADEVDLEPRSIKELCFMIADQIENLFIVLLSNNNGKVCLLYTSPSPRD